MPSSSSDAGSSSNRLTIELRLKDDMMTSETNNSETITAPIAVHSLTRQAAFVFTICMVQVLQVAGISQSIAPLHIIADSFGGTSRGKLSWTTAAYSLTGGVFILPAGRLGVIFGHKRMLLYGIVVFALWSLIAGFSVHTSYGFYAACRACQGIGAALMIPNATALVDQTFEDSSKRSVCFMLFGLASPVGWLAGITFASVLAQLVWWPWVFWTSSFVALMLAILALFSIPSDNNAANDINIKASDDEQNHGESRAIRKFDFLGTFTGCGGLVLMNKAWNRGEVDGWQTNYNYVLVIVGVALFSVFIYVEAYLASNPLVPLKNLTKESAFVLIILSASWASFAIWLYYAWQMFVILREASLLMSSVWSVPGFISGLVAAVVVRFSMGKVHVAWMMVMSMLFYMTAQILMATMPIKQTYWTQTFISCLLVPWGMELSFAAGVDLLRTSMSRVDPGLASNLLYTVANWGISMGLAFGGSIEIRLEKAGQKELQAFRGAWWLAAGFDGLGLIFSLYFLYIARQAATKRKSAA